MEHRQVQTNGITLHVVQDGPQDGPLVILLHGFPEFWYGWRRQIPALAQAGYRVWAPDQRGYNRSDKPPGIAAYNLDALAQDVLGLIQAAGEEQAAVIGHDWGAGVAWWLAMKHPQAVGKLGILNVPHPAVQRRLMRRDPGQLLRSWYMFFFQIPWLPEALMRMQNYAGMVRSLERSARPGTFTPEDLDRYREAWSQPSALTSMIHWYRAIFRHPPQPAPDIRIHVPTQIIWGAQDRFLKLEGAKISLELCDQGRLTVIPEATHWVQHEEAARVNELLLAFLAE